MKSLNGKLLTIGFFLTELVLYALILTTGGVLLKASMFLSIVICFLYALAHVKKSNTLLVGGLACTVMADFCLVVCTPVQQLWGMIFFLIAQTQYAILLHRTGKNRALLIARLLLIVLAEIITFAVLQDKTDALALVSLCYYANLIMNIVTAFAIRPRNKLLPIGFVLFLLCDTVIGLQVAAGGYLPISESSVLYRLIFMDFNLSWFFYLPSQVILSLCSKENVL